MKKYESENQRHKRNLKARVSLLYVLGELGAHEREVQCQRTFRPVADLLGLTSEEKNAAIRGISGNREDEPWQPNIIRWARYDLHQFGLFARSTRGYWLLNSKGQRMYRQLKESFEASGLSFPKFVENLVDTQRPGNQTGR